MLYAWCSAVTCARCCANHTEAAKARDLKIFEEAEWCGSAKVRAASGAAAAQRAPRAARAHGVGSQVLGPQRGGGGGGMRPTAERTALPAARSAVETPAIGAASTTSWANIAALLWETSWRQALANSRARALAATNSAVWGSAAAAAASDAWSAAGKPVAQSAGNDMALRCV